MRQFSFIPAYYEWHLIDNESHETLHNIIDPIDLLYNDDGTHMSLEELTSWVKEDLIAADMAYSENTEYSGIWLCDEKRLDQVKEIPAAAKVIADTLYNYYIE